MFATGLGLLVEHKVEARMHELQPHTKPQLCIRGHRPLCTSQFVSVRQVNELCSCHGRPRSLASECERSHRQYVHL